RDRNVTGVQTCALPIYFAKAREFWSFRPIQHPPLPQVRDAAWPRTSIDYFVLAELEQRGLHPVESADKRTLIRRATLDLIGLPRSEERRVGKECGVRW